jgi:hypothetical protein
MRLGATLNTSAAAAAAQDKRKAFAAKKQSSSDSNSSQRIGRLQRRPSFQKEEKKDAHPITLAVQNNYPQIAEMILRQMTLEEAVNGTSLEAKPRAAESQSVEPKPTQDLVQSVSMRLSRERK